MLDKFSLGILLLHTSGAADDFPQSFGMIQDDTLLRIENLILQRPSEFTLWAQHAWYLHHNIDNKPLAALSYGHSATRWHQWATRTLGHEQATNVFAVLFNLGSLQIEGHTPPGLAGRTYRLIDRLFPQNRSMTYGRLADVEASAGRHVAMD